jgi:hypothetical protein
MCILKSCSIKLFLHRPHSRLTYSHLESLSRCTPESSSNDPVTALIQQIRTVHTAKALEAIHAFLSMFALPSPALKHTPLLTCALAMAIMGQLSACSFLLQGSKRAEGRERVRLGLGALKAFVDTWPLGVRTLKEMKAIARDMLCLPQGVSAQGNPARRCGL